MKIQGRRLQLSTVSVMGEFADAWEGRILVHRKSTQERYLGVVKSGARRMSKYVHGLLVSGYLMNDGRFIFKRHLVDAAPPSVFIINHEQETDDDYWGIPSHTSGF